MNRITHYEAIRCEYNPETRQASYVGEGCRNEATISVGWDGQWHLCESCAALPEFRTFTSRRPITRRSA